MNMRWPYKPSVREQTVKQVRTSRQFVRLMAAEFSWAVALALLQYHYEKGDPIRDFLLAVSMFLMLVAFPVTGVLAWRHERRTAKSRLA